MWDLPGPGLEPTSPALAGGFLTTAAPGKPHVSTFLWEHLFSFLLDIYLGIELLGYLITIVNILATPRPFSKANTFFPPAVHDDTSDFSISSPALTLFFYYSILMGGKWYFTVVLIYILGVSAICFFPPIC